MKISAKLIMICALVSAQSALFGAFRIAKSANVDRPVVVEERPLQEERRQEEEEGQGRVVQEGQPLSFATKEEMVQHYFGNEQSYTSQEGIGILRNYFSQPKAQRVQSPGQAFWATTSMGKLISSDWRSLDERDEQQGEEFTIADFKDEFEGIANSLVLQSNGAPISFVNNKQLINSWITRVSEKAKGLLEQDKGLRSFIDGTLKGKLSEVKGLNDAEKQKIYSLIQSTIVRN